MSDKERLLSEALNDSSFQKKLGMIFYDYVERKLITSKRVTPAASERSLDVEQQAQEDDMQLPKKITR